MSSPSIKVVLPLADAHTNRRTGGKAVQLSKLVPGRFSVPKGFVLSADAYRSHLWASGARAIASAQAEAEDREAIRAAILAQAIPEDIWNSIAEAYERLSWQIGVAEPKVAVRSSALEDARGGAGFPGAYESYMNVAGLENLDAAIKRVWASLWSGKAAAYRARYGSPGEPAMGVIVQQMIDASLSGTASTANPVTGDPHSVGVTVRSQGRSSQYAVSLDDFSVTKAAGEADEAEGDHEAAARAIAEQAVLLEDSIGGRLEIEWALDSDLWILQAGTIDDLPCYFPTDVPSDTSCIRVDERTLSHLARSMVSPGGQLRLINGHAYRKVRPKADTEKDAGVLPKDMEKRLRLLREIANKALAAGASNLQPAELASSLRAAARDVQTAYDWLTRAEQLVAASSGMLGDVIEDALLLRRILGGVSDVLVERDTLLQELSERFAIAEKSGKLENEIWWRGYKKEVEQFACGYGYSFKDPGEAVDPSRWQSWIEDGDAVFRMIGAISQRGSKPTLVTLHASAEHDARTAEAEALANVAKAKQSHLQKLIRSAQDVIRLRADAEQAHCLASSALRLLVIELAARLVQAGTISAASDIFHLELAELLETPTKLSAERNDLAARIARRKHERWLEDRLAPPAELPISEAILADTDPGLHGVGACPGSASGHARIVSTIEEAAETGNGDILVVHSPGAAWTPFLTLAGGLVCERGYDFSPAVIAARTYGIPVVVGCTGAMAAIKEGIRITVDGWSGSVSG